MNEAKIKGITTLIQDYIHEAISHIKFLNPEFKNEVQ